MSLTHTAQKFPVSSSIYGIPSENMVLSTSNSTNSLQRNEQQNDSHRNSLNNSSLSQSTGTSSTQTYTSFPIFPNSTRPTSQRVVSKSGSLGSLPPVSSQSDLTTLHESILLQNLLPSTPMLNLSSSQNHVTPGNPNKRFRPIHSSLSTSSLLSIDPTLSPRTDRKGNYFGNTAANTSSSISRVSSFSSLSLLNSKSTLQDPSGGASGMDTDKRNDFIFNTMRVPSSPMPPIAPSTSASNYSFPAVLSPQTTNTLKSMNYSSKGPSANAQSASLSNALSRVNSCYDGMGILTDLPETLAGGTDISSNNITMPRVSSGNNFASFSSLSRGSMANFLSSHYNSQNSQNITSSAQNGLSGAGGSMGNFQTMAGLNNANNPSITSSTTNQSQVQNNTGVNVAFDNYLSSLSVINNPTDSTSFQPPRLFASGPNAMHRPQARSFPSTATKNTTTNHHINAVVSTLTGLTPTSTSTSAATTGFYQSTSTATTGFSQSTSPLSTNRLPDALNHLNVIPPTIPPTTSTTLISESVLNGIHPSSLSTTNSLPMRTSDSVGSMKQFLDSQQRQITLPIETHETQQTSSDHNHTSHNSLNMDMSSMISSSSTNNLRSPSYRALSGLSKSCSSLSMGFDQGMNTDPRENSSQSQSPMPGNQPATSVAMLSLATSRPVRSMHFSPSTHTPTPSMQMKLTTGPDSLAFSSLAMNSSNSASDPDIFLKSEGNFHTMLPSTQEQSSVNGMLELSASGGSSSFDSIDNASGMLPNNIGLDSLTQNHILLMLHNASLQNGNLINNPAMLQHGMFLQQQQQQQQQQQRNDLNGHNAMYTSPQYLIPLYSRPEQTQFHESDDGMDQTKAIDEVLSASGLFGSPLHFVPAEFDLLREMNIEGFRATAEEKALMDAKREGRDAQTTTSDVPLDRHKRRLARKAELARASRRRKKAYVGDLQRRVYALTSMLLQVERICNVDTGVRLLLPLSATVNGIQDGDDDDLGE